MPDTSSELPSLRHVMAFDAVATGGSMRNAAETLHVTQPAVTYAIRMLERKLDVQLFERRQGGSFLTESGSALARRTQRLRSQLRAALGMCIGADAGSDAVSQRLRRLTGIHIRTLTAIAKTESFRAAASSIGIADPTLHRSAYEIQTLLKVALYKKSARGLGLLPAGAELARRFQLASIELKTGIAELGGQRSLGERHVSIGILPLAPWYRLAEISQSLSEKHAGLRITLLEGGYDAHMLELRSGAIDMIFGAIRLEPPFDDLCEYPMFDDPYCIVCRKGHPLADRGVLTPADLAPFGWVFPTPNLPRRKVLDMLIRDWGLSPMIQIETNSPSAITAFILASDRLALWPRSYVDIEMSNARVSVLNLAVPDLRRQVGIIHRHDWLPTNVQSELLNRILRNPF